MSARTEDEGGFLARWSRRKREIAEPDKAPVPPPEAAPQLPAAPVGEEAASAPEMIEPPSLDLVDKDFDVAHWLKQNVPESWKLAALRRAWEGDPGIRDYLDPARDYALDWNTPGGAPGYGPLTESDDVAAMVRKVFGDAPPEPAVIDQDQSCDTLAQELSSTDENAAASAAMQHNAASETPESSRLELDLQDETQPIEAKTRPVERRAFAAAQQNSDADIPKPRLRKRGGGATPL